MQKNIRARENYMKKKFIHLINRKKYSCYGLKKIHTRNLIKKKNSNGPSLREQMANWKRLK